MFKKGNLLCLCVIRKIIIFLNKSDTKVILSFLKETTKNKYFI